MTEPTSGLWSLNVCYYKLINVRCVRCGLRYNAADPFDKEYHEKPGGCR